MITLIRYQITYFFLWVAFFIVGRAVFVFYLFDQTQLVGFQNFAKIFGFGLRLDLSAAGYFSLLPFLLTTLFVGFSKLPRSRFWRWIFTAIKVFTIVLLTASGLLVVADLELYKNWGFRIDDTIWKYMASPKEATATVSSYPIFTLAILAIGLFFVGFWAFDRFFFKKMAKINLAKTRGWRRLPMVLSGFLITASLIIPIRGGFQLAPVNQSAVYFSTIPFANHAAVNGIWNFFVSTFEKSSDQRNPYILLDNATIQRLSETFLPKNTEGPVWQLLRPEVKRPNVLIITYESLTAKVIEKLGGEKGVTPNFDTLTNEGVLFTNIFAAGERTDKGLVGVLSAYPTIPRANVMEIPRKSAQLPSLGKVFSEAGYATGFYYGGEAEFANMKSYLLNGKFNRLITIENFEKKDLSSKWGAFDHVVFRRVLKELDSFPRPFFTNLLTLSSHEPFEVPAGWGKPDLPPTQDHNELFRRVHFYSDQALGEFIREAKKKDWWRDALVIIIADHSVPHIPSDDFYKKFHIPMLWIGGALAQKGIQIDKVGSQTDLAATLLGQLKMPHSAFKFSKNLLDARVQPYAYFASQNFVGFVEPNKRFVYDTEGRFISQKNGNVSDDDVKKALFFLQTSYQDYLEK